MRWLIFLVLLMTWTRPVIGSEVSKAELWQTMLSSCTLWMVDSRFEENITLLRSETADQTAKRIIMPSIQECWHSISNEDEKNLLGKIYREFLIYSMNNYQKEESLKAYLDGFITASKYASESLLLRHVAERRKALGLDGPQ